MVKRKAGTPTMGVNYYFATLVPVLLVAKLENIYIILLLVTTLGWGLLVLQTITSKI